MTSSFSKLFAPLQLGAPKLKNRVILAPLTRVRAPEHIIGEHAAEYSKKRASDGGLLISEATYISVMGGNGPFCPGIFTPEQVRAWKKVTGAVHSKGGLIVCQLIHAGRAATSETLGGRSPVAPSATILEGAPEPPRALTIEEIKDTVSDFVHAAKLSIGAGFEGAPYPMVPMNCAVRTSNA